MTNTVCLLHLSDLHVGDFFAFDNPSIFLSFFKKAARKAYEDHGMKPAYLICTGDLTSTGTHVEVQEAVKLLEQMASLIELEPSRIIVCPGNHDVLWSECEKLEEQGGDPQLSVKKLACFLDSVRALYDTDPQAILKALPKSTDAADVNDAFSVYWFAEENLIIYSLSSITAESHRDADHYGYVGIEQTTAVENVFEEALKKHGTDTISGAYKIALVHHPMLAPGDRNGSAMRDPQYFENWLRTAGIDLVLHGHQHYHKTTGIHDSPKGFLMLGAGSIGVSKNHRDDTSLSLNLIRILHPRCGARQLEVLWGEFRKSRNEWDFRFSPVTEVLPITYAVDVETQKKTEELERTGLRSSWETLDKRCRLLQSGESTLIEGSDMALQAYIGGIDVATEKVLVTSFLDSQFWHSEPLGERIVASNKNLVDRLNRRDGYARRLFITTEPVQTHVTRWVQRASLLKKEDGDPSAIRKIEQSISNLGELSRDFSMRIVNQNDLPATPIAEFAPENIELAIYDDRRIDRFRIDKNRNIVAVEVYPRTYYNFNVLFEKLQSFFDDCWKIEPHVSIDEYISMVQSRLVEEEERIEYTANWLLRFQDLTAAGEPMVEEECQMFVQMLSTVMEQYNIKRFTQYLDVGVCTGRYPRLLLDRKIVEKCNTIDVDEDVERYMRINHSDIPFHLADIRDSKVADLISANGGYNLITCMLGTASHFGLRSRAPNTASGFERGFGNMIRLLADEGLLAVSVWSPDALNDPKLENIYLAHEMRRLGESNPQPSRIRNVLKSVADGAEIIAEENTQMLNIYLIRKSKRLVEVPEISG